MNIPFFNYPALFKEDEENFVRIFRDVGNRGAYIMQKDLADFEAKLADYLGVKYAIGCADGTLAILMGLIGAGIGEGQEVILPSHTFVASAAAIHHAGAKPVLVECGRDHLIDASHIEQAITPKTTAIMPVQLNGRVADMDPIIEVAEKHGLKIIEDSCQALGAKYKGRFAGTFGHAGSFSFYPAKTLGAFGDAGAMITDRDDVAEIAMQFRDHGRGKSGKVERFGLNARLDNLHAAILLHKLGTYDEAVARRREIASLYHSNLNGVSELLLPPNPQEDNDRFDVYQNYEIEADNRDGLKAHLADKGVGTILQWGGHTVHQFETLELNNDLPYTDAMTAKFLMLPLHTALSDDDVLYVCDAVKEFYAK